MTPGFAKSRKELFWLPYPEPDKVLINAHNFASATFDPSVNGKTPISAWVPSRDTAGNGTTTLTDLSTGGNNGTLTNMATPASNWVADTGAGGVRALEFDGTNDYVALGSSAALSIVGQLSISCWYKSAGSYTQDQVLIGNCDSSGGFSNYILSVGYSFDRPEFWQNAAGPFATSSTGISDTNWHHIVAVRSGSSGAWNIKIYLDGTLVANANTSTNPTGGTRPTTLGRFGTFNGYHLRGRGDDWRIWNQPLDATDVSALYASGAGRGIQV